MAEEKPQRASANFVGKTIYLRALTADDAASAQLWQNLSDPQSLSCRPSIFRSPGQAAEAFKKAEKSADRQRFAVVRQKDNTLVGMIGFFDFNALNRSVELGLIIDPDERRKGYGREALRLLSGYLFRFRGLNKVHAQTAAFNKATVKLLESSGFKRDAVLRDHYFYDGAFHDGLIYSLLSFEFD